VDVARGWKDLAGACASVASSSPALAAGLEDTVLSATPAQGLARLLGRTLHPVWLPRAGIEVVARTEFERAGDLVAAVLEDLQAISARNLEPGGAAWTWLGGRGFHILAAHRVIHALWTGGQPPVALAMKAGLAPLGADIHPAARFGRRIFLDHGVGLVVGETATIGDDVSIWHGVTLGSTLMQDGDRHPKVGPGAVIGAGATVLGNVSIGEGAIVASGSVVLKAVPSFTVVAGNPATPRPGYRHPYGYSSPGKSEVA